MAGIQMKIDILNVKKCTWLDIWSTCVSRSTPEFRSDLKAFSWNRSLVGSLWRCKGSLRPLHRWLGIGAMWLEGGLHGNVLCEASILLESVRNQFVALSAMLLTKCGKMQWGESMKQGHDGRFLSNWLAGRERWRSFYLRKGVASLKSLSVGSPRASHSLFFRSHVLHLIIQPKKFYWEW